MASPFAGTETYKIDLVDPSDGETWEVTMRSLSAGHQAKLLDQLAVEEGEGMDGDLTRPRLGTSRLLLVSEAVVKWTLPQPPTPHTIAALRPDLFEQLYEQARFAGDELGNPTPTEASTDKAQTSETSGAVATAADVDAS